jgi:DNA-binding GntR family transcriptional regulator
MGGLIAGRAAAKPEAARARGAAPLAGGPAAAPPDAGAPMPETPPDAPPAPPPEAPSEPRAPQKDAYALILEAIDTGLYRPGDRLVESELAERFGVSRTPIREAMQRLETQAMLTRVGRSLIVASLDHNQLAELYVVRAELEGLAARLAAQHAAAEEIRVLNDMVAADRALVERPAALSRANRRFHHQIHLASHNRYLVQQLDLVHRSMALLASTSLAVEGRGERALDEHQAIVRAIEARDGDAASAALKRHLSQAFETRLKLDAGAVRRRPG